MNALTREASSDDDYVSSFNSVVVNIQIIIIIDISRSVWLVETHVEELIESRCNVWERRV